MLMTMHNFGTISLVEWFSPAKVVDWLATFISAVQVIPTPYMIKLHSSIKLCFFFYRRLETLELEK
jgi:hypothetical protein